MKAPVDAARTTPRRRPPNRRAKILDAAVELFLDRGFHAVSIDDIGSAAGIAGPSIYKHFASKADILVEGIEKATQRLAFKPIDFEARPMETFRAVVRDYLEVTIDDREVIALFYQELRNLPDQHRARLARVNKRYTKDWRRLIAALRPDLSDAEATSVVYALFGLLRSASAQSSPLDVEQQVDLFCRMAEAAALSA